MNIDVIKIHALNSYGRKGEFVSINWGTREFSMTFAMAKSLCGDKLSDSVTFVTVTWYPTVPTVISVTEGSMLGHNRSYVELPLEGPLATVFMSELQVFAQNQAIADIAEDERKSLIAEANRRVALMVYNSLLLRANLETVS